MKALWVPSSFPRPSGSPPHSAVGLWSSFGDCRSPSFCPSHPFPNSTPDGLQFSSTPYLYTFTVSLCSSWVTSPGSQTLFELSQKFLVCPCRLPAAFAWLPACRDGQRNCSWAWRRWTLTNSPGQLLSPGLYLLGFFPAGLWKDPNLLSWSPVCDLRYLPCSLLSTPCYYLMVTSLTPTFTSLNSSLFKSVSSSRSAHPHQFLNCLCQKVVTDALQKTPGLLVPCCDVPPTHSGVVKVPHEDQGHGHELSSSYLKKTSSTSWSFSPQETPTAISPTLVHPPVLTHEQPALWSLIPRQTSVHSHCSLI